MTSVLVPKVATALWGSLIDGSMIGHAAGTLYRVLSGLGSTGCGCSSSTPTRTAVT